MRIIKDEQFIRKEYDKDSYLIKSVITDSDIMLARNAGRENKILQWDCNIPLVIHSANLLSYTEIDFPNILKLQKELYFLIVPPQLTKKINSSDFLKQLRGVIINGGSLKLKESVCFEHLLSLNIDGDISFTKENLPNLKSLYCRYDSNTIRELHKYDIFDMLSLSSMNDNIFDEIGKIKDIFGIQINRGKIDSIKGISLITSLHSVSLDNLPKLTDLTELTQMPNLEHLQIGYCKNIRDWDFLLELKNLKRLWYSANSRKEYPPQSIIDILKNKGIKM